MMYRLFLWIFGYTRFFVKGDPAKIADCIIKNLSGGITVRSQNGGAVFDLLSFSKRKTLKTLESAGFCEVSSADLGLPFLLFRYRKRWGIIAGLSLFVFIVYFSSCFVWRIDVIGNNMTDDKTITEELEKLGFGVGTYIPDIKVKLICNEYMLEHDDVAWMSINIIGTHADVRVREAVSPGKRDDISLPSDITAARDGFIERIELRNGQIMIGSGSTVRAGETVVSGVVESADGRYRLVRSDAKVFAKTTHEFTISVPYTQVERERTESERKSYSIVFFSNFFSIIDRSGSFEGYESERTVSYISLPDGLSLPVGIAVTAYYSYSENCSVIDEQIASEIARRELAELISAELGDAEIVSITREISSEGDAYLLKASVCCIEDIAKERFIAE